MDQDLSVRPDTVKFLDKNLWCKFLDIGFGNDFFGFDTKSKGNKSKSIQVGLHEAKKLPHSKRNRP